MHPVRSYGIQIVSRFDDIDAVFFLTMQARLTVFTIAGPVIREFDSDTGALARIIQLSSSTARVTSACVSISSGAAALERLVLLTATKYGCRAHIRFAYMILLYFLLYSEVLEWDIGIGAFVASYQLAGRPGEGPPSVHCLTTSQVQRMPLY